MTKSNIKASIIITAYDDYFYLKKIIEDIFSQEFDKNCFEVLILDASLKKNYELIGYIKKINNYSYWHYPKLSRTSSLNFLIKKASSSLIIRLDSRTHINKDYLSRIINLSNTTGAANVGGMMVSIGISSNQKLIARCMSNRYLFGGASFRNNYYGEVDTVYLGCFNLSKIKKNIFFDETHPKISEDSDFNYQLLKDGNKIFMDSKIKAYHYAREDLSSFKRLCFNYGVGRGLFVLKNKTFNNVRRIFLPLMVIILFTLICLSFFNTFFIWIIVTFFILYLTIILFQCYLISTNLQSFFYSILIFLSCHYYWTLGFYFSPVIYFRNNK